MIPTKEEFINYINLIKKKQEQQNKLCDVMEELSGGFDRCDTLIFSEYENALYSLLSTVFNDEKDLIGIALYELNGDLESESNTLKESYPALASWEQLYDYLLQHLAEGEK